MKIKHIIKLSAIPLLLLASACDKFLDVVPKGVVIPQTLEDYQALLSAPLVVQRVSNNTNYVTDEVFLPESGRPGAARWPGNHAIKAYDFEDEYYDESENDADWNAAYTAIYTYNTIIDGISDNSEDDIQKKNVLKGEALVHRAYNFLTLVNQYAKHYSATADTDLGVPLPLQPDINALLSRSTVKEVYTQVEKDLIEAVDLLPTTSTYTYRPNKAAALGTLARMYLYQGDWAKAYEYADETLKIFSFVYDYNTFSYADPSNRLGALIGYPSAALEKKHIILYKYLISAGGFEFNFVMSDEQAALFEEGDLREVYGTNDKNYWGEVLPGVGVIENKGPYDYDNAGITTQEMILIRAESAARLNNLPQALKDLNELRALRFTPEAFEPLESNDQSEVLDLVLNERRIELAFIGLRLADIKRLSMEGRNIPIKRGDVVIEPNDPRLIFPIPPKNISVNPNLEPNPR